MALVIIGGLLISTFLTSVLLPTTTTILEDTLDWLKRKLFALGGMMRILPRARRIS